MKRVIITILLMIGVSHASEINKCLGCHGKNFEKQALGKSLVVKDMTHEDILMALEGYKDATYGGPLKTLMITQLKDYNTTQLEDIAYSIGIDSNLTENIEVNLSAIR